MPSVKAMLFASDAMAYAERVVVLHCTLTSVEQWCNAFNDSCDHVFLIFPVLSFLSFHILNKADGWFGGSSTNPGNFGRFSGRVAAVTGGADGLGKGIVSRKRCPKQLTVSLMS